MTMMTQYNEYLAAKKALEDELTASGFTLAQISDNAFGLGGVDKVAVCNKCGSLVYPTTDAAMRHNNFHAQVKAIAEHITAEHKERAK